MFVILLSYKEKLDVIDQYLIAHRAHLDEGYRKNFLIASGPQNPRTGGVLLSQLNNRSTLEVFLKADPFYLHNLIDYQVIEFTPVKHHPDFSSFIEKIK